MNNPDALIGVREVADLLDVSVGTVHSMRHRNTGPPSWKRGKRLVWRRGDVTDFLVQERASTLRGAGV